MPLHRVEAFALLHRLVGAGLVDFVGGLAVQPVVGAAEAEALGRDDADVVGREGLAQQARIEGVDRFIGHGFQPAVALIIDFAGNRRAAFRPPPSVISVTFTLSTMAG